MILRNARPVRNDGNRSWGGGQYLARSGTLCVSDVAPRPVPRLVWLNAGQREGGASDRLLQMRGLPLRYVKATQSALPEPAMLNGMTRCRINGHPVVDGLALPLNWDPDLAVVENLITRSTHSSGTDRADQVVGLLFPGSGIAEGEPDVRSVNTDEESMFCKQLLSRLRLSAPV